MTVIIGFFCKDSVVVGADSSTTFVQGQYPTIEQYSKKIKIIDDKIIMAGTGEVGLSQRFETVIKGQVRKNKGAFYNNDCNSIAKEFSKVMIEDVKSTFHNFNNFGALVAFPAASNLHLCEFSVLNFQYEFKNEDLCFVSMGSGQAIADPFLGFIRRAYLRNKDIPNLQQGIFFVYWALMQAIELNAGGIKGPPSIAILTKEEKGLPRARFLSDEELVEHEHFVKELESHINSFKSLPGDPPKIPQ